MLKYVDINCKYQKIIHFENITNGLVRNPLASFEDLFIGLKPSAAGLLFKRMSHQPANILENFPVFLALGGQLSHRKPHLY